MDSPIHHAWVVIATWGAGETYTKSSDKGMGETSARSSDKGMGETSARSSDKGMGETSARSSDNDMGALRLETVCCDARGIVGMFRCSA